MQPHKNNPAMEFGSEDRINAPSHAVRDNWETGDKLEPFPRSNTQTKLQWAGKGLQKRKEIEIEQKTWSFGDIKKKKKNKSSSFVGWLRLIRCQILLNPSARVGAPTCASWLRCQRPPMSRTERFEAASPNPSTASEVVRSSQKVDHLSITSCRNSLPASFIGQIHAASKFPSSVSSIPARWLRCIAPSQIQMLIKNPSWAGRLQAVVSIHNYVDKCVPQQSWPTTKNIEMFKARLPKKKKGPAYVLKIHAVFEPIPNHHLSHPRVTKIKHSKNLNLPALMIYLSAMTRVRAHDDIHAAQNEVA